MKKAFIKFGQCFAALAFVFATLTANSSCMIIAHQPKEPDAVKKLRCSLPSKTQKSDTQNTKNRSDLSDLRKPERFFLCNIIF